MLVGASVSASALLSMERISSSERVSFVALNALYALVLVYFGGKIVSYYSLVLCQAANPSESSTSLSSPSPLCKAIFQPCLQSYYYHVAAETTGFALKTFFIDTLFGLYYEDFGLLVIAMWSIFALFLTLLVIALAEFVQSLLFKDPYVNEYLLDYDSDAFALAIAATVLIITYKTLLIAPTGSFLFSWEEKELPLDDSVYINILLEFLAACLLLTLVALSQLITEVIRSHRAAAKKQEIAAIITTKATENSLYNHYKANRQSNNRKKHLSDKKSGEEMDDLDEMVESLSDDDDDLDDPPENDPSSPLFGDRRSILSDIDRKNRLSERISSSIASNRSSRVPSKDIESNRLPTSPRSSEANPANQSDDKELLYTHPKIITALGLDIYLKEYSSRFDSLDEHVHRIRKAIAKLLTLTTQGYMLGLACIVFTIDSIHTIVPSFSYDAWSLLFLFLVTATYTNRGPRFILKSDLRSERSKQQIMQHRLAKREKLQRQIELLENLQRQESENLSISSDGSKKLNLYHVILRLKVKAEIKAYNDELEDKKSQSPHSPAIESNESVNPTPATRSKPNSMNFNSLLNNSTNSSSLEDSNQTKAFSYLPKCLETCLLWVLTLGDSFYVRKIYHRLIFHRRLLVQVSTRLVIGFLW